VAYPKAHRSLLCLNARRILTRRSGENVLGRLAMTSTRSSEYAPESPCGRLLHGVEISVRPIVRIHG